MESQEERSGHWVSCGPLLDRMRKLNPLPVFGIMWVRKHLMWDAKNLVRHEEGLPDSRGFAVLQRTAEASPLPGGAGSG